MNFLNEMSLEDIKTMIKESNSYADFFSKINRSPNSGSNRIILSQYIRQHNIDVSHFPQNCGKKYTANEVFVENSLVTQKVVRRCYKDGNYTPYKCAICGLEPFWNGQPLTLTLDHINGKNNDNRLTNLRWVCPNCDRQLPTFGAKKLKKQCFCKICGCEISIKRKSGMCHECYIKERKKNKETMHKYCIDCGKEIDKDAIRCVSCLGKYRTQECIKEKLNNKDVRAFLKVEIRNKSFEQIARENNIVSKTLRYWCKLYNLPSKKTEINAISDEEWQNI